MKGWRVIGDACVVDWANGRERKKKGQMTEWGVGGLEGGVITRAGARS